jgi:membrane-associated protein
MIEFLNPEKLIPIVGVLGVGVIAFVETAFLIGVILPGDSLVFTAGIFSAQGYFPLYVLITISMVGTILGDQVGYLLGKKYGPVIFNKEDSFFFKKSYVEKTKSFFDRYGKKTVLIARFIPIVRTFVPPMAGISKMSYFDFARYNILGGILWSSLFSILGYFLGLKIGQNSNLLTFITLGIIILSFLSGFLMFFKNRS